MINNKKKIETHGRSQSDRRQVFKWQALQLIKQIAAKMYSSYIGCRMINFKYFIRKWKIILKKTRPITFIAKWWSNENHL